MEVEWGGGGLLLDLGGGGLISALIGVVEMEVEEEASFLNLIRVASIKVKE